MAILWLTGLVFIYVGLYLLNKGTPKPEGCEELMVECDGCTLYDCTHNKVHKN